MIEDGYKKYGWPHKSGGFLAKLIEGGASDFIDQKCKERFPFTVGRD